MSTIFLPGFFAIAYDIRTGTILWVPPLQTMAQYAMHFFKECGDVCTAKTLHLAHRQVDFTRKPYSKGFSIQMLAGWGEGLDAISNQDMVECFRHGYPTVH